MECASSYLPNAIFQSYHAEKEDIFPYERLHRSLIYYSLPTKASVWLKTTAIFQSLAISGKKGNCLKVKMTLWRHSSPRVHDGNCWQKKVTVTVKDLSIKTWCLLHLRKASIWFVTDDQNLLCMSPPSISAKLGSRRCARWQIKSNHQIKSLFLVRSDQVQVVLACLVSPKHCECEAHSRRRNGGSAGSIILPEYELLGWRRKAGHRRDTVTFSASSPDIRAVDHRK